MRERATRPARASMLPEVEDPHPLPVYSHAELLRFWQGEPGEEPLLPCHRYGLRDAEKEASRRIREANAARLDAEAKRRKSEKDAARYAAAKARAERRREYFRIRYAEKKRAAWSG